MITNERVMRTGLLIVRDKRAGLRALSAFIVALMIATYAGSSISGKAQTQSADTRANQVATADQQEPTLAVDPTNANNVLAAAKDWRTGPKQVWYYHSTDAGRTWTDGHIDFPSELPNQSDPVIVFDASGTAYIAILAYNQNDFSIGGFFVVRSNDGGTSWQQPVLVNANSKTAFNDKEWIATDRGANSPNRGNLYGSWTLFTQQGTRNERGDIVFTRSTDGGKTFSPPQVVSLPTQANSQGSFPAVGPNGEVYVLYFSGPEGQEEQDEDRGKGAKAPVAQATKSPAQTEAGLYVAKSTDGGQTFPIVKRIAPVHVPPSPLPGSKFRLFVLPTLAVDPRSGSVYATWNDYASGDADILLVKSTDGGQTWSSPLRVNDDSRQPAHDQFFPAVTVGSDSVVHLLWLDRRDDPQNKRYLAYYARSADGGNSFTKNLPVSTVPSSPDIGFEGTLIGDYISIDTSSDGGSVYTAWVDTRGGNQDIYFERFSSNSGPTQAQQAATPRPTPAAVPSPQPLTGFSDEGFLRTWERADRPVALGKATRPWLWGPAGFATAYEPYAQGKNGLREVEYFDKARMEVNNPGADRNSPYFVTNGLLVVELITGRVQTGDAQFEPLARPPSQMSLAGDINSTDAVTYASLTGVASLNNDNRAQDRTGADVTATLNRTGQVGDDRSKVSQVRIERYEATLGHNIPDVFWTFMNSSGPVYNGRFGTYADGTILNWETDLGYPITEAYWTTAKIGGVQKQVLVQAFQRRVLTYVADNPTGWKVEMGNVGRHYYDWRYIITAPRGGK